MKNRFKKGQIIFQVEIHNDRAIAIWEKEVISCGKKILKLKGEYNNEDFRINTIDKEFSLIGKIGNFVNQFNETHSQAENEMNKYNRNN